ncbi:hypothetical protein [Paenibacillus sp. JDR-2]|uniref:hypothetical protein n=1 Tax=Paenibacillus sp. (strain JDR-2) TaxID=324057 RepID=UPI000166B09D|nr:hypothetical protein [Paenibacillus sp. JDR-2]ACS99268.1 hypothetical protein Pjdr2_0589 [Paenibacillus sp. JDR-2]
MKTYRFTGRLTLLLFLLGAFVLFSMPTMMLGNGHFDVSKSSRTHIEHSLPNSMKAIKRVTISPATKLFAMLALLAVIYSWVSYPRRFFLAKRVFLLPFLFLERLKRLLMPLKLTTSYPIV